VSRRVAAWLACFLLATGAPLLGACGNAAPDEAVVEVVLFVDAAAQPGGDGSKDLPLPTIGAALALGEELAPDALTIEVAAGMYDEGALVIRGATAIRGSGKRPEIRGSFEVASAECSLQGLAVRDPGLAGVDVAS
jgi:hypothetical protein